MKRQTFFQHFIQRIYRHLHAVLQSLEIKLCVICKWFLYKLRQIDASQKTASPCRKRLLCTGIYSCIGELLCIAQKVPVLDPIPEQSSGFRIIPVCLCDPPEQVSGIDCLLDHLAGGLPGIMEKIILILLHRFHEVLMDTHGNICLCHLLQVCLQINELLHIRMGAVNGDHQGSPAAVLADQCRHQGIQLHKGYGTAGLLCRVVDLRSPGAQFRDVHAASAAVTVGPGQLLGAVKNTLDIILRRIYHITVGIGYFPPLLVQPSVGEDSSSEQEFLTPYILRDLSVAAADPCQPLIKGLSVIAVFLRPYVCSKLIILAQPFFYRHTLYLFSLDKELDYCSPFSDVRRKGAGYREADEQ